jgi:hypothetical protein
VHVLLSQALRLAQPAHMSEALSSESMPLAAVGGLRN